NAQFCRLLAASGRPAWARPRARQAPTPQQDAALAGQPARTLCIAERSGLRRLQPAPEVPASDFYSAAPAFGRNSGQAPLARSQRGTRLTFKSLPAADPG